MIEQNEKTKLFIEKAIVKHGDKYDYSKVEYIKAREKIIIICKKHGEFIQRPDCHLSKKRGCKVCSMIAYANSKKMTTEIFIKKAMEIHGDKYDYSKVEYIKSEENIIIICKEHCDYLQQPNNHLQGKGCKKCSIENIKLKLRSNTKEFIEKSMIIHGDKYDYSNVEYIDNSTNIIIICFIHGMFEQKPAEHLSGCGCQICGKISKHLNQTSNITEFIENARKIHSDKYDYSKVEYINCKTKVVIICKEHGEFEQIPSLHLSGCGCKKCGIIKRALSKTLTTTDFIEKAITLHGDKYDYSAVNYIKRFDKVNIICKIHGVFEQNASEHLSGCGCKKCGKVYSPTTNEFIENAINIHGDKYDYSKVIYNKAIIKVIIVCKTHGEFEQTPNGHLNGNGCKKCSMCGYSKSSIKYLNFMEKIYNIQIQHAENVGEHIIKTTNYRADGFCKETNTIYEFHGDYWHGNPYIFCGNQINNTTKCTFGELYKKTIEREQLIRDLGYNLVVIWEYDWNKLNKSIRTLQQKFKQLH